MNTKPFARRHHYLPQAYLAAFTNTCTKQGQFFVLNIEDDNSFRTSPLNVATERDFNRVDIKGKSPDAIENKLATFEEQAVKAIKNTISSKSFPKDQDYNLILNLLCLFAVRNPLLRKSFNRARAHVLNQLADQLVASRESWDNHILAAKAVDEKIDDTVSFEQMKNFIEKRRYKIEFFPEGNLHVEFKAFYELLPILGQRTWSLFVAPAQGPEFICSDHPVTLVWKNGSDAPVGYSLKGTEIFFPLSRKIGFYGTFEEILPPIVELKPLGVAAMNSRVFFNAKCHVFSALEGFFILQEGQAHEVYCGLETSFRRNTSTR